MLHSEVLKGNCLSENALQKFPRVIPFIVITSVTADCLFVIKWHLENDTLTLIRSVFGLWSCPFCSKFPPDSVSLGCRRFKLPQRPFSLLKAIQCLKVCLTEGPIYQVLL